MKGSRSSLLRFCAVFALLLPTLAIQSGAVRPIKTPAPEFPPGSVWVNSAPLTLEKLRGRRVLLVSFINAYSLNSTRTFPHLKSWWERYSKKGLMVIGVHAPDFDFDRDPREIHRAVAAAGLRFPVLIDGQKKTWNAYKNEGWPAHFLIDPSGKIIHDQLGEGDYDTLEEEITRALSDFNGFSSEAKNTGPQKLKPRSCTETTPSVYLGTRRGAPLLKIDRSKTPAIIKSREGEVAVSGRWELEPNAVSYAGGQVRFQDALRLIYRGAELFAVASSPARTPTKVYLKQDNLWLHSANAGTDVLWDDEDRSYFLIEGPKLFSLVKNPQPERVYELHLHPLEQGISVSGFEFSNSCEREGEAR